jgi:hypothetical protein
MSSSIPSPTIRTDSGGAFKGLRNVLKNPGNDLKRWRREFDAHAKIVEGEK